MYTVDCFVSFQGIALQLLDSYIRTVDSEQSDVTHILLICKSNLIPLYTRAGFILRGKSEVVHGMSLILLACERRVGGRVL